MLDEVKIDYLAAIEFCKKKLGYAQGTSGCVAFAKGAEWMRDQINEQRLKDPSREDASDLEIDSAGLDKQQAALTYVEAFSRGHDAGWASYELHVSLKNAESMVELESKNG